MNLKKEKLTEGELALILNIREETLLLLVQTGQIPSKQSRSGKLHFDFYQVLKCLEEVNNVHSP